MPKNKPKTIRMNHIVYPADDAWLPLTLRNAFGDPLPRALAAHRDDTGAVPVRVIQRYVARLRREALRAFDRNSQLVPHKSHQHDNGPTAQKGTSHEIS